MLTASTTLTLSTVAAGEPTAAGEAVLPLLLSAPAPRFDGKPQGRMTLTVTAAGMTAPAAAARSATKSKGLPASACSSNAPGCCTRDSISHVSSKQPKPRSPTSTVRPTELWTAIYGAHI
eukprot:COSAG02_NODE_4122_length_5744_cov_18.406909_7_plen_120_part_00